MELLPSLLSTLRTVDPGTLDQEYSVSVCFHTSVCEKTSCRAVHCHWEDVLAKCGHFTALRQRFKFRLSGYN